MLDEQIKSKINRSKGRLKDQILDQQIKNYINRSKVRSTDQILDH